MVALSTDDVVSQKAFAKAHGLAYPLLSDPDGSAAAKYGALMRDRPFATRVTFVIDPSGVLRHVDTGVQVATHGRDLAARLRELQSAAEER